MTKRGIFIIIAIAIVLIVAGTISIFTLGVFDRSIEYVRLKDPQPTPWMLRGVALDLGNPSEADEKSIESPLILKMGDSNYVMWYRGQTYADKLGRIMRATSTNGINWTKTGVVMIPAEPYEEDKIDPMAVIYENGEYKMWYGAPAYGGCACYATSRDGIKWERYQNNPVLRKTSGAWDNEGAGGQLTVIKDGDKYKMYYKGFGSSVPGWTFYGLAESSDGIRWTKKGKVLSPDPELGETTIYKNLFAFRLEGNYYLVHSMADYLSLFLCTSTDGRKWHKNGFIFLRGQTPGNYDVKWATSPCLIVDRDVIRMWYEGGDPNGRVRTLLAEVNKQQFVKASKNVLIKTSDKSN